MYKSGIKVILRCNNKKDLTMNIKDYDKIEDAINVIFELVNPYSNNPLYSEGYIYAKGKMADDIEKILIIANLEKIIRIINK